MNTETNQSAMTRTEVQKLAIASVAVQDDSKRYPWNESLAQGTLFPALNLPFYLALNGQPVPVTPLSELQALDFVTHELGLYLDTHCKDQEAMLLFKKYAELSKEAKKRYEKVYGPLTQCESIRGDGFSWVLGPWPWERQSWKEEA